VVLERDWALLSDQDPYAEAGGETAPEKLAELREDAILAGWMENAAVPVNRFLSSLGIPIQVPTDRVLFGVFEAEPEEAAAPASEGLYTAVIRVETPSTSQARALAALVSMARMVMGSAKPGAGGLMNLALSLFANPPVPEEQDLIIRTGTLSAGDIALLFDNFSVYSI
jgi:hypothetical protein